MDKNKLEKQAIGIVAQLFDLAEVPIEKRQQINDIAYDYMLEQLRIHDVVWQIEQLLDDEEELKCPDHTPYWGVCSTCGQY
jgi:hypothetical protein